MKRKLLTVAIATMLTLVMCITALAYTPVIGWKSDNLGWHYDKTGYGEFAHDEWLWIDGNNDGIAECYNFDSTSFMRANTTTPDGYTVNEGGAWTVDGVVQTKAVTSNTNQNNTTPTVDAVNLLDLTPVDEFCFNAFKNYRTNQNALWADGFYLQSNFENTFVEYYIGEAYNTLTFTYAPNTGAGSSLESTVEVYGDDDSLLWSSDTITYKTNATEATVDISGQEYIKINLYNEYRYTFFGSETQVLFKNAKLQ